MKRALVAALLLTASMLLPGRPASATEADIGFKLLLLRHAEKAPGPDPALSTQGEERAQRLARELAQAGIKQVWSTDTRRTRQTAEALSHQLNLPLQIYVASELSQLAQTLLANGTNAVVVGHSDSTPALATLLCQCATPALSETDYDWIYQIEIWQHWVSFSRFQQTR